MAGAGTVAVLDIGRSNIKLSACTADGAVLETLSTPNPVLPMVDYEQPLPDGLAEACARHAGSFPDRGCAIVMSATHVARQMFRAERDRPANFARARRLLGIPQYWAWRLSGVAVSEVTILGAQPHLWNVAGSRRAPIVAQRG